MMNWLLVANPIVADVDISLFNNWMIIIFSEFVGTFVGAWIIWNKLRHKGFTLRQALIVQGIAMIVSFGLGLFIWKFTGVI